MLIPIRQSTAGQTFLIGAFIDDTDFKTLETGLTIANTDIKLSKNGASSVNKNSGGGTHIVNGMYAITINATDSNTVGKLQGSVLVAGALSVWFDCIVYEEAVYDLLYPAAATGNVKLQAITHTGAVIPTVSALTGHTAQTGDNFTRLGAPAGASVSADILVIDGKVSNLTVAGSASKLPALLSPNGFVITFGENEVNNEDVTRPLDGITHDIEAQNDTGTERIEVYYETNIGAGEPSEVTWHGRLDKGGGSAKNIDIQVQDVDAATWRTIGNVASSTLLETHTFDIFLNEVGTGVDLGTVRIRFITGSVAFTATTKLLTDQIFVSFNAGSVSSLDAVYFDSTVSNTGTTSSDGIPGNPVSTEAAINTLLAARNLNKVVVAPSSSITFATDHMSEEWIGELWTLGLGGRNLASSLFVGADVSGIHTGVARFISCDLGTMSTAGMTVNECGHSGTITITAAGAYVFNNSYSKISGGTTPIIDTGALIGNVDLSMPDYHNGIELQNIDATGTDNFSISGIGQIIYAATCSGTVHQRGDWKVTNTGSVTIIADDNTTNVEAVLADTNELQSDDVPGLIATLNDISPAGVNAECDTALIDYDAATGTELAAVDVKIDIVDANIDILLDALLMQSTTIATLTSQTSFTLTAGSADNDAYSGATILIVDSVTGVQKALGSASGYTGSTKRLILAQDPGIFIMAVGDTVHILTSDTFAIIDRLLTGETHNVINSFGKRVRDVIDSVVIFADTAVSGTSNTITLPPGASSVDGAYDPAAVTIVGGTGAGQSRLILQYDGTTKVAIVDRNWKVTPDGTSVITITTNPGREHVNEGLAQAGATSTITLNTLASSIDSAYVGQMVFIRSGTGDDQAKLIIAYNGTTKVATTNSPWGTIPDATSAYVMLPTSPGLLSTTTQAQIDDILANTAEIGTAGVGLTNLGGMSTVMKAQVLVETLKTLTTQMTEDYAGQGIQPNLLQAIYLMMQFLNDKDVVGVLQTIYKLDGTTVAATSTLDSATAPTSISRTS